MGPGQLSMEDLQSVSVQLHDHIRDLVASYAALLVNASSLSAEYKQRQLQCVQAAVRAIQHHCATLRQAAQDVPVCSMAYGSHPLAELQQRAAQSLAAPLPHLQQAPANKPRGFGRGRLLKQMASTAAAPGHQTNGWAPATNGWDRRSQPGPQEQQTGSRSPSVPQSLPPAPAQPTQPTACSSDSTCPQSAEAVDVLSRNLQEFMVQPDTSAESAVSVGGGWPAPTAAAAAQAADPWNTHSECDSDSSQQQLNVRPLQRKFSRFHGDQGGVVHCRSKRAVVVEDEGDQMSSDEQQSVGASDDSEEVERQKRLHTWINEYPDSMDISLSVTPLPETAGELKPKKIIEDEATLDMAEAAFKPAPPPVDSAIERALAALAVDYATAFEAPDSPFREGVAVRCHVTRCDGPLDVCVVPLNIKPKVEALEKDLSQMQPSSNAADLLDYLLRQHPTWLPCVALDESSSRRCRARIEAAGIQDALVCLVDYGMSMWMSKSLLLPLPRAFALLPPAAFRIAGYGVDSRQNTVAIVSQFNEQLSPPCQAVIHVDVGQKRTVNHNNQLLVDIWDADCQRNITHPYKRAIYQKDNYEKPKVLDD